MCRSIGGVAMGTCHGGGIRHATIADRILELEYVDSEARLQTVRDKEALSIAAGHTAGTLLIVTTYSSLLLQKVPSEGL